MTADFRIGFCVSGQGRLFREAVKHRDALGIEPALLVADYGASSDLEAVCSDAGISVVRLVENDGIYREQITRAFSDRTIELFSLTFDRILPPDVLAPRPDRIINVHPGLLPAFRGKRAVDRAVAADVRYSGATIHVVTETVDQGPIVAQCVVGTQPHDSPDTLGERVYGVLLPMYLQVLKWYVEGRVRRDGRAHLRVNGAVYGTFPVSPAVEHEFSVPDP